MPFGSQSSLSSSSDESVYGSINANNDVEMAPSDPIFTGEARSGKNSNVCGEKVLSPRTRLVILGAVLGVVLLMLGRRTAMPASHQLKHGKGARIKLYNKDDSGIGSLSNGAGNDPFQLSPVENLGMLSIDRADDALPSPIWGNHLKKGLPLPTNSWYLNLVSHRAAFRPDDSTRVYTVPYIIDTASPYPGMEGLRVHWPVVQASDGNVQMVNDFKNALCIGSDGFSSEDGDDGIDGTYRVKDGALSPLGVGLEWGAGSDTNSSNIMSTNIVRGMPYATMVYSDSSNMVPTIYSYNGLASDVQIDRTSTFDPVTSKFPKLVCGIEGTSKKGISATVHSHLHLHMINSDFTWIVFFNKPVKVSCVTNNEQDPKVRDFKMTFLDNEDDTEAGDTDLVVRIALLNQCTTGHASIKEHCKERNALADKDGYELLLKNNAHLVPQSPTIDFEYASKSKNDDDVAKINIDWDVTNTKNASNDDADLLMFALPHHQDSLSSADREVKNQCVHSFHGKTCLVSSSNWTLEEDLGSPLSFDAPRPPSAEFIPTIAKYLKEDIKFEIPKNTMRGASDTYFSGKILGRLARIVAIASELRSLASASSVEDIQGRYDMKLDSSIDMLQESMKAAASANLPSSKEFKDALDQLKSAVQAWLKSDADAPYIYDKSWGGLVNCGCSYVGKMDRGYCNNTFPECPALLSVNEDFGNGYYNDHHYHYGYHVYAAAVAAKFDPAWGRKHFEEVMLYIRDFANPKGDDEFFPQYRQKDWFLGSSWASGIISAENSPHGRNEESSSEAISAYEGVTLYGSAMVDAFEEVKTDGGDEEITTKLETAKLIRDSGQLLTASEISATNRYWHVWSSDTHNNTYPAEYTKPVVGMLYDTMAMFQTWFAPWAVVSYGIQLIPLTPVAETRDDPDWAAELYPLYDEACDDAGKDFCEANGWSILQAGLLATAGNQTEALNQAKAVPRKVFATEGGVGNSMSNTIWYIATRKKIV